MRTTALCLACALGVTVPLSARADETPRKGDVKQSDELAARAYEQYQKGDFAAALSLYTRAYQASPAATILFNIANIYDKKVRDIDLAEEYYRKYLRSPDTEADLVRRATERLAALKAEREAAPPKKAPPAPAAQPASPPPAQAAPPTAPQAPPPDERSGSGMRTTGLVIGGLGLVGLGVGTVFGLAAKSKNDDASKLCDGRACRDASALTLTDDARRAATVSTISFVVGGVAFATGAVLLLVAPKGRRQTGLVVAPQIGATGGGLSVMGGFQ